MRRQGFTARTFVVGRDDPQQLGPGAWDVVVAGELAEHLDDVGALFALASDVLASNGRLVLTTPNPYAPHRVRSGQLGLTWENVEHVVYLFPAGVAELADRHDLTIVEFRSVDDFTLRDLPSALLELFSGVLRRLLGRHVPWLVPSQLALITSGRWMNPFATLWLRFTRSSWLRGETMIYVCEKPLASSNEADASS